MRVLFITGEFPPMQGGVGDCTNEIAKALSACGVEVQVLTSRSAVNHQPSVVSVLPTVDKWNWSILRVISNVCRAYQPHIVHLQYQTGAFGMHPAINFLPRYFRGRPGDAGRVPRIVTTFHDLRVPYLFPKAGPVRDWVTRSLAEACDAVIATNDEDYARLATWTLRFLSLIPIGSNIAATLPADYDRNAWRAKLGVAENETLLCYFGFLNESKGGETLVRALAQMPQAKLLMLGGQTGASDPTNVAYLAKIKSLISNLQLTNRVLWTDHVAPAMVSAHLRACDVCVLPYRDGASYRRGTLMAALAHGCAIVTTVVNAPASVVSKLPPLRDGENCMLIPPDAPPAIVSAVQRLMASRELREHIGAGAQKLAAHFTWDKIAQQHLELYERMAN